MRAVPVVLAAAVLVTSTGCQVNWSERFTGTAIGVGAGGLAGGLLGAAAGSTGAGIVLGALAGGAAGYILGDYRADSRERAEYTAMAAPRGGEATGPEMASAGGPAPAAYAMGVKGGVAAARGGRDGARREYEAGRRSLTATEALAHYDAATRLDPTAPEPRNAKGLVLLYGGDRAGARREFEGALAVDPTYGPAKQNLARVAAPPR